MSNEWCPKKFNKEYSPFPTLKVVLGGTKVCRINEFDCMDSNVCEQHSWNIGQENYWNERQGFWEKRSETHDNA
jgi:hypothetical protein